MGLKSCLVGLVPFGAMVVVGCLDVGLTTTEQSSHVRRDESLCFCCLLKCPFHSHPPPFFLCRFFLLRPPLTFSLLCRFFLLSLAGITVMQNCVFTGGSYSSPTLASAMSNLIPAFTFLLAVIFRMEKIDLGSSRSQIKILGTLVSITGALIVTLYKGPPIGAEPIQSSSISSTNPLPSQLSPFNMLTTANNWVIGGLFLATASFCVAIWNISQAAILKGYPSELTIVSFYCFFGTIQETQMLGK